MERRTEPRFSEEAGFFVSILRGGRAIVSSYHILNCLFLISFLILSAFNPSLAFAQTDLQKAQNLSTCLSGKYLNLCKHAWLTPAEREKANAAERNENLKTCLTGRYPSLCRKNKLTAEELKEVMAAEKRENLKTCLTGKYKSLCEKNLLTKPELQQVLAAEKRENLNICMTGRYTNLCDHSKLTPEQLSEVKMAEKRAIESQAQNIQPQARTPKRRFVSSGCENGH
jgi:hypothetical protein